MISNTIFSINSKDFIYKDNIIKILH